jgi:hypothetical protein
VKEPSSVSAEQQRIRAVYCSVDPATAILEVAVHGFQGLDTVLHMLTAIR